MKLFTRKFNVPTQNRPDYDYINKAEKELRVDDEGFNERFDEALISDYKARRDSSQWTTEERLAEVKKLSANLTSFRWKMVSVSQTNRIESRLRDEKYGPGFSAACQGLRNRMMRPKSLRNN